MEKKNQLVVALLMAALGVGAYVAYSKGFFGGNKMAAAAAGSVVETEAAFRARKEAALAAAAANGTTDVANAGTGNIPGTNASTTPVPAGPTTTIKWAEEKFDFGTIKEGETVKHKFKFTNTGSEPLIISNAKGSCGCTVPTWPKEAIAPGQSGTIDVEFNSTGKPGQQSKRVTVTANTVPTDTFIEIAGMVTPKDSK